MFPFSYLSKTSLGKSGSANGVHLKTFLQAFLGCPVCYAPYVFLSHANDIKYMHIF